MRITIVGAGAMGGFVGTRLAGTGEHAVSAFARGATGEALRSHGWRARSGGTALQAPCAMATDDAQALGPQDLVIVALKAQHLPEVAPRLTPLLAPHTRVLSLMNGVPWWFTHGLAAAGDTPLASVDPDGGIARALPPEATLGGVLHMAGSTAEPGVAEHRFGMGIILGEATRRALTAPGAKARGHARADRGRLRRHTLPRHPPRRLVQAVGEHDDQPDLGAHRIAERCAAHRSAGA